MHHLHTAFQVLAFTRFFLFVMFFSLKVQMQNGEVYEANIKDIDKKSDIATIKINPQVSGGSQASTLSAPSPEGKWTTNSCGCKLIVGQ